MWCGRSFWQDSMGQRLSVLKPRRYRSLASNCIDSLSQLENSEDCKNIKYTAKCMGDLALILPRSRTGTVWFYTSTSNKRAARPKLYTESLIRDLKHMYSRFTLVRISIKL